MDLNFWIDEVERQVREGKSIRKACLCVKRMKEKYERIEKNGCRLLPLSSKTGRENRS